MELLVHPETETESVQKGRSGRSVYFVFSLTTFICDPNFHVLPLPVNWRRTERNEPPHQHKLHCSTDEGG